MIVDVVVRCRNEMPWTARTLGALSEQTGVTARVLFIDCGSTDGSREAAVAAGLRLLDVEPRSYIPGAVLNLGLRQTASECVAFVNADAVPLEPDALARLVAPLQEEPDVVATYGRQTARPEADALVRADYARAFGERPPPVRHGPFFSMAASAIRRSAWEQQPFDERLRYSEDVDWIRRAVARGGRVRYVPGARFEHSHNYTLRHMFRRHVGEGAADTLIHGLGAPSAWADFARPLAGTLVRDARNGLARPSAWLARLSQAGGRFVGRVRAWRRPSDPWPAR